MRSRRLLLVVAFTVAACGSTPEERGITGGGIGAASGAVVGAVTGLTVLEGALIGGAVGAAGGALTDKEDFYLGEPLWKRGSGSTQTSSVGASSSLVANTQASLAKLGYDPGPVDGVLGPKTAAAIRTYQFDYGLTVDGQPSEQLERHIMEQTR